MNNNIEKSFSGFSVGLKVGSKRKQRLSNHFRISIDDDRVSSTQKLTLRQARALQKFLNENLPSVEEESDTSTSESA